MLALPHPRPAQPSPLPRARESQQQEDVSGIAMAWLAWENKPHLQDLTREPPGPEEALRLRPADWLVTAPVSQTSKAGLFFPDQRVKVSDVSSRKRFQSSINTLCYHLHNL